MTTKDTPTDADSWEQEMRHAFGVALAAAMDYMRHSFKDVCDERDRLKARVTYLETRLDEIEKKPA